MKRLLHRLFGSHKFTPYGLVEDGLPITLPDGTRGPDPDPNGLKVWYIGYRCWCGEPGYVEGPIGV